MHKFCRIEGKYPRAQKDRNLPFLYLCIYIDSNVKRAMRCISPFDFNVNDDTICIIHSGFHAKVNTMHISF